MDGIGTRQRNLLGWLGTACLFLILPIKLLRHVAADDLALIIGIVPSLLGPPGLLFLLLSSTGRRSRLTLPRATLIAGAVAVGLELLQLLPRPGILARVHYTFDSLDLASSLLSLLVGYLVARRIARGSGPAEPS